MDRAHVLALLASAVSEPWAVRREWMDALSSAALAVASGGDLALPAGVRGRQVPEAPAAIKVTYLRADDGDDHDEDDLVDDIDSEATDQGKPQTPPDAPENGEDGSAGDAHPDQAAPDDEEDDDEDHPDPNSGAGASQVNAALHPATARATAKKSGSIAVIPINGTISPKGSIWDWIFGTTPTTPANIAQAVTDAANDESVKAIVLNIDSGGGSVVGITEAHAAIMAARGKKPIVAQVCGACCSAAYWLASAADEIAATQSATVGGIGVYTSHDDVSEALAKLGVKRTYVQAGAYKTEGAPEEPLSEEAQAHMQEYVDDFMSYFAADVAAGRGVPVATVTGEPYGQGRSYAAPRAAKRGLVDKVRSLSDTVGMFGASMDQPTGKKTGRALNLLRREVEALDL
jgi:signal peptide peptidase SppA